MAKAKLMKSELRPVTVKLDKNVYSQLSKISGNNGESLSNSVRRLINLDLTERVFEKNADLISQVVREQLEIVMKSHVGLSELIKRKMEADETKSQDLTRKLLESEESRRKLCQYSRSSPAYVKLGRAYNNKGITLLNLERFEEALECFNSAIETDPLRISYYTNKGVALDELLRYDEALVCFDKVINELPFKADIQEKWMDYSVKKISWEMEKEIETKYWQNIRTVKFVYDYTRRREISKLDDWIPDSNKPILDTIRDIVKDSLSNYTRPQKMTRTIYHKVYMIKRWKINKEDLMRDLLC